MKKQLLAISVLGILTASTQSHAVYNLYKNDGLSLDVNGEINLYLEKDEVTTTGQGGALAGTYEELSDERLRLFSEAGASWIDFRGSQDLGQDLRVTGTLGMGYAKGAGGGYLNTANISFDKLNVGAVSFGRQYLHTGFVTRTGTFTPLDVYGEQSLRLDYYGLDNLHTSAYYLFPSSNDVRNKSNSTKTEGFGASASYTIPFNSNHSLRLAAGYSNSKANPRDERTAFDTDGTAISAEYRLGKFLLAGDYGRQDANIKGAIVAKSKADYAGVKIGYELTPKFNLVAGYGTRTAKATYANGVSQEQIESAIGANIERGDLSTNLATSFMYGKLTEQKTYVRGDYYLKDNVRLYGQVQDEQIQGKVFGQNYAKLDSTSYQLGVSLSF